MSQVNLNNPNYDCEFLIKRFTEESPSLKRYIDDLIKDTDHDFPTNEIWLGTIEINNVSTQIKLTVTQEDKHFIDESE